MDPLGKEKPARLLAAFLFEGLGPAACRRMEVELGFSESLRETGGYSESFFGPILGCLAALFREFGVCDGRGALKVGVPLGNVGMHVAHQAIMEVAFKESTLKPEPLNPKP